MPSRRGRQKKRQHAYRRPKDKPGSKFTGSHLCPECGKWCFLTRDDAEAAARRAHPGATCRFYQCESTGYDWWHYTSMNADQVADIRARQAVTDDDDCYEEPPEEVALRHYTTPLSQGDRMPRREEPRPPMPAPHPPGCLCGPWTFVHGHWSFVIHPRCPHHGNP